MKIMLDAVIWSEISTLVARGKILNEAAQLFGNEIGVIELLKENNLRQLLTTLHDLSGTPVEGYISESVHG